MHRVVAGLVSAVMLATVAAAEPTVTGAGATFPAPVYASWAAQYKRESGIDVVYEAVGSGAGMARIRAGVVDFGASDVPVSGEERELVQFPAVLGGVVPVVSLAGLPSGRLRLSGELLARIFLGQISKWNAPEIAALNPGVTLPSSNITVVHRSDLSGTTFLWSDYLARSSAEWASKVGVGMSLPWPVGIGEPGNEGVAASVQRTRAAIGYVEYAYARQHNLEMVSLRNREGAFIAPEPATFEAALRQAQWRDASALRTSLLDAPGKTSWPITAASFILLRATPVDPGRTVELLKFFDWALSNGQQTALSLGYVPIPDAAVRLIQQEWNERIRSSDGTVIWPPGTPLPRR